MYNKLFSKILDSSVWLESDTTRIVWFTMLATMDEDGYCHFASVGNLAQRAIVPVDKCKEAVKTLESPDIDSGDPSNEGRRIERVPGGWIVLNAKKYKDMVTAVIAREQTRIRVADFRERKKNAITAGNAQVTAGNAQVTAGNAQVTAGNAQVKNVTQSETETRSKTSIDPLDAGIPLPLKSESGSKNGNSPPKAQGQNQKMKPAERDTWDLRRFQEARRTLNPQVGTQEYYLQGEEKIAYEVKMDKEAAFIAGLTLERLIELVTPFHKPEYIEKLKIKQPRPKRKVK